MNTYYNPVHTLQGPGSLNSLPDLARQSAKKGTILLLIWNESLCENETIRALSSQLGERLAVECCDYSNPTTQQLYDTYLRTKNLSVGLVIAIGGGSILDVGKSLCCLYSHSIESVDALRRLIADKAYGKPACPWIGVPTTAGTGSEVTCWATIWDPEHNVKYSIDTADNYAFAAVVDPELLSSMPLSLAVSSALDAVAHATESYWAKASNAVSKALALRAIRLVMAHIGELAEHPDSACAHDFMSQGSLLAGLAFSNTRTTGCHSISYPLTMRFNIPHGTAVSLLLAPVLRLNAPLIEDLPALLDAFGVRTPEELGEAVTGLLQKAGIPATLSQWGVTGEDLDFLAAHSITKGRADNNPAQLTEQIVHSILTEIL